MHFSIIRAKQSPDQMHLIYRAKPGPLLYYFLYNLNHYSGEEHLGLNFTGCNMNIIFKNCTFNLFKDSTLQTTNAICTDNIWFTKGHIEEAGNENVAYFYSGPKIWFGAKTVNASRELEVCPQPCRCSSPATI